MCSVAKKGAFAFPNLPPMADTSGKVRLQRYLADAGVAARRVCEALIEEGRVEVNGRVVTKLPAFVDPETDKVVVDGRPLKAPGRRVYLILHKPTRTLVTAADEPGFDRRTVLDLVDHPAKARLFPVGRLHYDATGLVLLTNDGEFANLLTHPRYGVPKTYWAVVRGTMVPEQIADIDLKLKTLDRKAARAEVGLSTGPKRRPAKAAPRPDAEDTQEHGEDRDPETPDQERPRWEREHVAKSTRPTISIVKTGEGKTLLEISMLEARNRQLEDVLQSIGSPVKKLTRVGIGPLRLKGLGVGQWRELTGAEITLLKRIAKQGGGQPAGAVTNKEPVPGGTTLSRTQRQAKRERERLAATGFAEVARPSRPGRPGHLGAAKRPHPERATPTESSNARKRRRKDSEGAQ